MKRGEFVIGVLGGMGTYATINMFDRYAGIFPAEKEWDRPRIIIDNNCTMPSRVRAILYKENVDILIEQMTDSIRGLIAAGATRIILGCNTSHVFLPDVYEKFPEAKDHVVDMVECCAEQLLNENVRSVYLLATEGTILSRIYDDTLKKYGIECVTPTVNEFSDLRECIEAVKQKKDPEYVKSIFLRFFTRYDRCILGCTELPILYEKYKEEIKVDKVYDPLDLILKKIKKEFDTLHS